MYTVYRSDEATKDQSIADCCRQVAEDAGRGRAFGQLKCVFFCTPYSYYFATILQRLSFCYMEDHRLVKFR